MFLVNKLVTCSWHNRAHQILNNNEYDTLPVSRPEVSVAMRPITVRSPVHTTIPRAVPMKKKKNCGTFYKIMHVCKKQSSSDVQTECYWMDEQSKNRFYDGSGLAMPECLHMRASYIILWANCELYDQPVIVCTEPEWKQVKRSDISQGSLRTSDSPLSDHTNTLLLLPTMNADV